MYYLLLYYVVAYERWRRVRDLGEAGLVSDIRLLENFALILCFRFFFIHIHVVCIYEYIYIYIGIVKNVSFFRCSAAAKYFAAKILYPQWIFAAALLNFAAILLSTKGDPNSCGPVVDGPFRDPKGRSFPHPKYWTHRWRIGINIGHGISPIEPN